MSCFYIEEDKLAFFIFLGWVPTKDLRQVLPGGKERERTFYPDAPTASFPCVNMVFACGKGS